jgi:XTP/dITP diphosphohydrolase
MPSPRLLLATNNKGKVAEFRALLEGCGWDLVAPPELGLDLDVKETGRTYAENALLKALAFASISGLASLADDSGLEVDALDGEPGPLHHVLGWDGANNDERISILLSRLDSVADRRARFRAVIIVAFPDGRLIEAEGVCEGAIALAPSGASGFGYDPVFVLPDGRIMAELKPDEKNRISHRARAVAAVRGRLKEAAAGLKAS